MSADKTPGPTEREAGQPVEGVLRSRQMETLDERRCSRRCRIAIAPRSPTSPSSGVTPTAPRSCAPASPETRSTSCSRANSW